MVVVEIKDPNTQKLYSFYMDGKLNEAFDKKVINSVHKKDKDRVIIVDGHEGSGKSTFACQLAKKLYPKFSVKNICFNPDEFVKSISEAEKYACILYDEAFTGISSRASLSEVNRMIVSLMMEMRQKNLFVIIVLPTFFLLDKYVALWRARDLFHVYERNGERGFWVYYNRQKKKILYLKGKKEYDYAGIKSNFRGRFTKGYVIDEEEYLKKKELALKNRDINRKDSRYDKYMNQRNTLLYIMNKELKMSQEEISNLCKQHKVGLKRAGIQVILSKIRENKEN